LGAANVWRQADPIRIFANVVFLPRLYGRFPGQEACSQKLSPVGKEVAFEIAYWQIFRYVDSIKHSLSPFGLNLSRKAP
jgi:hypothetical protein